MARTRNSDPGRVDALHYAATQWQRHAKRLVYAYSFLVGLGAGGWGMGLGTAYAHDRLLSAVPAHARSVMARPRRSQSEVGAKAAVPCVACQVISLQPQQVVLLPDRLSGARMLVRVRPGAAVGE